MSPSTSACYPKAESREHFAGSAAMTSSKGNFQFGIRKQEISRSGSSSPLKVSKDSHRIRKPPLPLPQVQYRPPIIIHTYSPKVIHTEPDDFMSLVQKLTGSSDTRLRLKRSPSSSKKASAINPKDCPTSDVAPLQTRSAASVAHLERQGSSANLSASCGSPGSSSDDSAFLVSDPNCEGELPVKQSNSPRSPLDSPFEFDHTESVFSHFDTSQGNFNTQVKAEPMFSFHDNNNPFNFFAEFMHPSSRASGVSVPVSPLPRPNLVQDQMAMGMGMYGNVDVAASPGFLSPSLMAGLPDISSSWSQQPFLDCLSGAPASPVQFGNQVPYQRQRYNGGYSPLAEAGNMVSLENIHAFMLS